MKFTEKKYRKAIAELAKQICLMVKDDLDGEDPPDKEQIWDECSNYMADAHGELDEALDEAYEIVFPK